MTEEHHGARSLAIGIGGALGALTRWQILESWSVDASAFAWPVLVCNVVGSLVLGAALAEEWRHPAHRRFWHAGVAIGFCGGLTTMSTVAVQLAGFGRAGDTGTAVGYGLSSIVVCMVAVVAGAAAMGRIRAIQQPVEEVP